MVAAATARPFKHGGTAFLLPPLTPPSVAVGVSCVAPGGGYTLSLCPAAAAVLSLCRTHYRSTVPRCLLNMPTRHAACQIIVAFLQASFVNENPKKLLSSLSFFYVATLIYMQIKARKILYQVE